MDEKRCSRCKQDLPVENFHWRDKAKGRRQPYCIECNRAYQREHYRANKAAYKAKAKVWSRERREDLQQKVWAYLEEHPCVDCGESDPVVLDFDHVVREEKEDSISRMVSNSCGWAKIQKEIAKCEIRCRNCHQRRTARQMGWYAWQKDE